MRFVFLLLTLLISCVCFAAHQGSYTYFGIGLRGYYLLSAESKLNLLSNAPSYSPLFNLDHGRFLGKAGYFTEMSMDLSVFSYGYRFNIDVPSNSKYFKPAGYYQEREQVFIAPIGIASLRVGKLIDLHKGSVASGNKIYVSLGGGIGVIPGFESVTRYSYQIIEDSSSHLGALYAVANEKLKYFVTIHLLVGYQFKWLKRNNRLQIENCISPRAFVKTQFSVDLDPIIFTNIGHRSVSSMSMTYSITLNKLRE